MKNLERYIGANYSDSFQQPIINETPETFPELEMPTITPETGTESPKTDREMIYLKNKDIDETIHNKSKKEDVCETDTHKTYNIIVGQTNDKLQEEAASDATFQVVKSVQYPIGYVMILNQLWFLNQS